jgi:hypothetical protein
MAFMKKNIRVLLLLLSFSPFCFYSQEEKPGKPNELDKQYTPDKNSILGSGKASSSHSSGGGSGADVENVVKFNFGLLARSTFAVFYERRIVEGFSVQGGIGYVYNKDKAQYFLSEGETIPLSETNTSLSLAKINKYGSYGGFNPFLSGSVRFHFSGLYSNWYYNGNDDRRNYFELAARFYTNHYDVGTLTSNERINGANSVAVRNTCYMMNYGFSFETDTKLVTTHEFYTGFGIRKSVYDKFTANQIANSGNGYITEHTKGGKESLFTPMIMMGYVLGFGF